MVKAVSNTKNRLWLSIFLLLIAIGYISSITPNLSIIGDDESHYIIFAKSLASGQGFRNLYLPGSPLETKIVPLLSVMLAPLMIIFPGSVIALKILVSLFAVLALFVFYLLLNDENGEPDVILVSASVIALALNPLFVSFTHQVATEIPYILISLTAIFAFDRYAVCKSNGKAYSYLIFAAIMVAASLYTRMIGAALFIAFFLYSIMKKKFGAAICLAVFFGLAVFFWVRYDFIISGRSSFATILLNSFIYNYSPESASPISYLYRVVYTATAYITVHLADCFSYPFLIEISRKDPLFLFKFASGATLFILIMTGLVAQARRAIRPHHIYVITYTAIVSSFFARGERYLLPLLPFLIYYFLEGARVLNKKWLFPFTAVTLLALNMSGDIYLVGKETVAPYTAAERSYLLCADWIRDNTPEESVILCRKPRFLYLYTGKKAEWYTGIRDYDGFKKKLDGAGVDYIIVDDLMGDASVHLIPFVFKHRDNLELVYKTAPPVNLIYKVRRSKPL